MSLGDLISLILLAESLIINHHLSVGCPTVDNLRCLLQFACVVRELGPTRRQVCVDVDGMSLQPSAGPINVVTDSLTAKPDDDGSSLVRYLTVVRLPTQAVAPLQVDGPQGWLHAEFFVEYSEDFLVGVLAVVRLRDTAHTEVRSSCVLFNVVVFRLQGDNPGFKGFFVFVFHI